MKVSKIMTGLLVASLAVVVAAMAEDFSQPVIMRSDIRFDTGSVWYLRGTKVTATAANLNQLTAGSDVTVGGTSGGAFYTVSSDGKVTNSVGTNGNVTLAGTLTASSLVTNGVTYLGVVTSASITNTGVLNNQGNTTLAGTLTITGAVTMAGTERVNGAATIGGALTASGAVTCASSLGIGSGGAFTFTSNDGKYTNTIATNGTWMILGLPATVQAANVAWSSNGFLRVGP